MLKPRPSARRTTRSSIITRDLEIISNQSGNIYESLVIVSKRARQISSKVKEELSQKISDFATNVDNLEEIHENREQIEISKYYERQPKPTILAMEEFLGDEIVYVERSKEEDRD